MPAKKPRSPAGRRQASHTVASPTAEWRRRIDEFQAVHPGMKGPHPDVHRAAGNARNCPVGVALSLGELVCHDSTLADCIRHAFPDMFAASQEFAMCIAARNWQAARLILDDTDRQIAKAGGPRACYLKVAMCRFAHCDKVQHPDMMRAAGLKPADVKRERARFDSLPPHLR